MFQLNALVGLRVCKKTRFDGKYSSYFVTSRRRNWNLFAAQKMAQTVNWLLKYRLINESMLSVEDLMNHHVASARI